MKMIVRLMRSITTSYINSNVLIDVNSVYILKEKHYNIYTIKIEVQIRNIPKIYNLFK